MDDRSENYPAEQRLLEAVAAGGGCDFDEGKPVSAVEMASWGTERTIRASVLRQLLTAEDAPYAEHGISIMGAAVEGVLNLEGLKLMPLGLQQCRIADALFDGATFTGNASFALTTFTGNASFDRATFTGPANFTETTFTEDASFDRATFEGFSSFGGATFTGNAGFDHATFTRGIPFGRATFTLAAGFNSATFSDDAWFNSATFAGDASFAGATFTGNARFDETPFTGNASFDLCGKTVVLKPSKHGGATFTGNASFDRATFTGDARFDETTFTGNARFDGATFTRDAGFSDATFIGTAFFVNAAFNHDVQFDGAIAHAYDFSKAQFHTTDPGPWLARRITLTRAVFHVSARVAVAAVEVDSRRLQAREEIHLICRGGAVNLEGAEFLRQSILEHSESELTFPERQSPGERPEGFDELPVAKQERWTARSKGFQLAQQLADELGPQRAKSTHVVSLSRVITSDLVLIGVGGFEDCTFAGAHGLDKLRIDATCSFQRPPSWPRDTLRPFTARRVIAEEAEWRQTHTLGWAAAATPPTAELAYGGPTALEIAGIYRDLRKGLEDASDEPGAADFYYGEMEMRRLAARKVRSRRTLIGFRKAIWHPVVWVRQRWNNYRVLTRGLGQSWIERRLLGAYWAVSGYGLRAWRALTALTILLVGCAALFTVPASSRLPVFAYLPPGHQYVASVNQTTGALTYRPGTQPGDKPATSTAVTFGKSMEFTARESLTLTRAPGDPLLKTTGAGTALDIALRLLAPLLLGLALLAVRGRTKR